jgi:DNA-binding ferritin-like protein
MEEVARTAAHIAARASRQAELAGHSEEAGEAGAAAVIRALEGMESMRGTMDAIAARAEALGKRSREIYGVLELINEIAQETHILSLNASIEAKAAGELGERFGVVAEEVRRLAERSRESVDSVRRLLDDFSASLRDMVAATDEGRDAASGVLDQARSAAEAIEKLRGALTETAQASQEISLATSEQRSASDQVVTALREISAVVQRTAEGLQELTATADTLDDLGLAIQLLTQSFRLKSPRSLKNVFLGWGEKIAGFAAHGEAARGILDQMIEEHPYVEFAYLVDREGVMVAFAANHNLIGERDLPNEVGVGRVFAERPWFHGVIRDGMSIVTPPYESLVTGQDCFTVAVAVRDDGGEPEGVLGADINVGSWANI